ncbi:hypothetical protein F5Y05DRAFT_337548 [Hypoxylon sp. FL0543]|nr:hypothetical protein F5Y05DRAFT_337548 [Hypoxylon sp. FL0543]
MSDRNSQRYGNSHSHEHHRSHNHRHRPGSYGDSFRGRGYRLGDWHSHNESLDSMNGDGHEFVNGRCRNCGALEHHQHRHGGHNSVNGQRQHSTRHTSTRNHSTRNHSTHNHSTRIVQTGAICSNSRRIQAELLRWLNSARTSGTGRPQPPDDYIFCDEHMRQNFGHDYRRFTPNQYMGFLAAAAQQRIRQQQNGARNSDNRGAHAH